MMSDELGFVRQELWDLLREVRDEEIDPESAELAVSILDSLTAEAVRVEGAVRRAGLASLGGRRGLP